MSLGVWWISKLQYLQIQILPHPAVTAMSGVVGGDLGQQLEIDGELTGEQGKNSIYNFLWL